MSFSARKRLRRLLDEADPFPPLNKTQVSPTSVVQIKAAKTSLALNVEFNEEPLPAKQKRLQHRTVLRPKIDLSGYATRAVLDWVDLGFRVGRSTQWLWIQAEVERAVGRKCFVRGQQSTDEGDHHDFIVRIQEPTLGMLLAAEEAVRRRWTLQTPASIENMEVSVDFRPKVPSDEALALLFGVLVRCHLPGRDVMFRPKDRPRFAWGEDADHSRFVLPFNSRRPDRDDRMLASVDYDVPAAVDATYYVGARGSQSSWRIMMKVIDRQNKGTGTRVELPEDQRRVRIEVTLGKDELEELGIRTLADLPEFRWQTLQGRFFQFRCPTFADVTHLPTSPVRLVKEMREQRRRTKFFKAGVVGVKALDDAQRRMNEPQRKHANKSAQPGRKLPPAKRDGAGFYGTLVAYEELTRPVIWALRHLGERIRSAADASSS